MINFCFIVLFYQYLAEFGRNKVEINKRKKPGFAPGILLILCLMITTCYSPLSPGNYEDPDNDSFIPVEDINGVPPVATIGIPLLLSAAIIPENATCQDIQWFISGDFAEIDENNYFTAYEAGTVTLTAFIVNGRGKNNFTKIFNIIVNDDFVPVLDIVNIPKTAAVGDPLLLSGTVVPLNATNQIITWSAADPDIIDGSSLIASGAGKVNVTAKIANGLGVTEDFSKDILIDALQPVTSINNVPAIAVDKIPLALSGIVEPENAAYKSITWEVISGIDATYNIVNDNSLETSLIPGNSLGYLTLKATVQNGLINNRNYTQTFSIIVTEQFVPVTDITGIPAVAYLETWQKLDAMVEPYYATRREINWEIKGITWKGTPGTAEINQDNELKVTRQADVVLKATITDGKDEEGVDFTKEFTVTVIEQATAIVGVPAATAARTFLTLTGTVQPSNADYSEIQWVIKNRGTTNSYIDKNELTKIYRLYASDQGEVIITGNVINNITGMTDVSNDFTVRVIEPVTNITGVPAAAVVGTQLALTGIVQPGNASYSAISWAVTQGNASISGNQFTANNDGNITVRATVTNGSMIGSNYTQNFSIEAIRRVTGITGVPTAATAGTPLALSGTGTSTVVNPSNASYRTIEWSVLNAGTTGSAISGNILNALAAGTVTVRASISKGLSATAAYTQDFTITVNPAFAAVSSITGVPDTATAGTPITLSGTVNPINATNKTIVWSVQNARTTGAAISGSTLNTTAAGTVTVRATVANGLTPSLPYTEDFNIIVNAAYVAVTGITGVPASAYGGTPLTLGGTVVPANATNKTITWSIQNAGTTGAVISGNTLNTAAGGTVTVRATIANGLTASTPFTSNYTITVSVVPVTGITAAIPATMDVGTLILNGNVTPANATDKTITWSVQSQGTTKAAIENNILFVLAGGTVTITGTVPNGLGNGTPYKQNFTITVRQPVESIIGIPDTIRAGAGGLLLSGASVSPVDASAKTISWSIINAGSTGAVINGNNLNTSTGGTIVLAGTVQDGIAIGTPFAKEFTINVIQPVANITDLTQTAQAKVAKTLSGTVVPSDASKKTIIWSILNAGSTGATITGNTLNTAATGTVTVNARIADGTFKGEDYNQSFTISVDVVPVTNIIIANDAGTALEPLVLSGTVVPENATNKTIAWSVINAGGTGAAITGSTLNATSAGTAVVRATITNGLTASSNYTQDFNITINTAFVPITSITGVPTAANAGTPLTLTGTVNPGDATQKTIVWSLVSAGTTGAAISGNTFNAAAGGTATVRATVAGGGTGKADYTQNFSITVTFIPVTSITGGPPASAITGTPLTLTGTVNPANATNRTISWSVTNAGTTGATISGGNTFNTTAAGTVTVRATVTNGQTATTNYTQDYSITVSLPYVAVSDITGVPTAANAGTPLALTGTVAPSNATNKTIVWSVQNAGTTGATISGNTLNTTAGGTATVRATIVNGATSASNYTKDFYITVTFVPVTGISGVTSVIMAGTPFTLAGTAAPVNATNKTIVWSVQNAGTTGAVISGSTLSAAAGGTATVRATITNGLSSSSPYTQDFNIAVKMPVTDIDGIPQYAEPGTLTLSAVVSPDDTSIEAITWTVKSQGGTGAGINDNTLNIASNGTLTITASIADGADVGVPFTKDFNITVIRPVTDIVGVPATASVGTPLILTGTVMPGNATNQEITWSLVSGTGASVTGSTLNTSAVTTVVVKATVANGKVEGGLQVPFTMEFPIDVQSAASITLNINNFTLTDAGNGVLTYTGPVSIVLAKSAGDSRIINANINDFTNVTWRVGNNNLGSGNTFTLKAANFNAGDYILVMTFTKDGVPWQANLPFKVTP